MGKYMLPREHLDRPDQYEEKKERAYAFVDLVLNEMNGFIKAREDNFSTMSQSRATTVPECCGYLTMPPYFTGNDQLSKATITCEPDPLKRGAIKVTLRGFAMRKLEDESDDIETWGFAIDNDDKYLMAEAFRERGYRRGKVGFRFNRNGRDAGTSGYVDDEVIFSIIPVRVKTDKPAENYHGSDYSGINTGPKVRTRMPGHRVRHFMPWGK